MRFLFALLILLPFSSFAQTWVHGTYNYSKGLGNGYGAGVVTGKGLYKNSFIGLGMEVVKYENLEKVTVPLSLNIYYDEKDAKRIGFMSQASYGWNLYSGGSWFYSAYFIGAKVAGGNFHPFVLLGVMRPHFKTGKYVTDHTPFTIKTGVSF